MATKTISDIITEIPFIDQANEVVRSRFHSGLSAKLISDSVK